MVRNTLYILMAVLAAAGPADGKDQAPRDDVSIDTGRSADHPTDPSAAQQNVPADQPDAQANQQEPQADRLDAEAMQPVAYLGIHAHMVSPTLRAQLDLPEGVGLVVSFVEPGSPADAAGLEQHDILEKFDDQVLVSAYQLKVLVRMRSPGDQVALTTVHRGRRTKLSAKFDRRLIPEADASLTIHASGQTMPSGPLTEQNFLLFRRAIEQPGQAVMISARQMSFSDGEHKLVVREDENGRHLRATNLDGEVIYDGYLNTDDQRAAMPAEIQRKMQRLNDIERQNQNRFVGATEQTAMPQGQGSAEPPEPTDRASDDTDRTRPTK
jgi:hypothetical protein